MTSPAAGNAFDKLRWIAAMAVLCSHSFPLLGLEEPTLFGDSLGKLAVAIFFAMSGYLVCESWERDPHLSRFAQRRALRIMATTMPVDTFLSHPGTRAYLVSNASLVSGVETVPGTFEHSPQSIFNGSLWTLRYEVSMYALLAFGAIAARLKVACPALFVVGFGLLLWFSFRGTSYLTLPIPGIWKIGLQFDAVRLVKLGTVFFGAACIYLLRHRVPLRRRYAALMVLALVVAPAGLVTSALLACAVPYVTLVIALRPPAALRGAAANDLSYGIYVYAYPVQQLVSEFAISRGFGWAFAFSASVIITLGLAALSWTFVERPALRLKPRRSVAVPAS
jgi:peptidoglycan/LPS O-acetylase OafA/YrhL